MLDATANHTAKEPPATACGDVVELTRLRYFHGRALGALDLRREQAYHLEKARLRNRLLHGWGIVCGLDVDVIPKAPCDPTDEQPDATVLVVSPGAALDCGGNEIIVRNPREVTLDDLLSEDELVRLRKEPDSVYLTLCYHEQPIDPSRPLLAAECEPVADCQYGRVCETYRICASTTRPDPGPACEPCCGACGDRCLELAEIRGFGADHPIEAGQLHFAGRRPLARHDLAEISEINWVHGATYTRDGAAELLRQGIEVRFSRPVQVASLRANVVELTAYEGGPGRSAGIYSIGGVFADPTDGLLASSLRYRSTTRESLQFGDRVTITIHGDHIVDECCRAIDAGHVGASIPMIAELPVKPVEWPVPLCPPRPSGNGTEGGEFVSWIFVEGSEQ